MELPILLFLRKKRLLFCGFCPVNCNIYLLQYTHKVRRWIPVTVRERILALKLLDKQEQHPEYVKRIGVQVNVTIKDPKKEYRNV